MDTPIKIKGHKLLTSWGGCEDTYAHGRCECGYWKFRGWTEKMRNVRMAHQSHLGKVRDGRPEFHPNVYRPEGFRFPWQTGE